MFCSGDSMSNQEVLKRGDLQMTSAGTGIRHSEKAHGDKQVHFLQIWAVPNRGGLEPQYFTRWDLRSYYYLLSGADQLVDTSLMKRRRASGARSSHPQIPRVSLRNVTPPAPHQFTPS